MLNPVAAESVLIDADIWDIRRAVIVMGWLIYAQISDAANELEYFNA